MLVSTLQFHCLDDLGPLGIAVDVLVDCFGGFFLAAGRSERLCEFAPGQGQGRLQLDSLFEFRNGFLEPGLHRKRAAQVLVELREIRLHRQREPDLFLGFLRSPLLHQCQSQQAQVIDGPRVLGQVVAGDLFGAQRPLVPDELEGTLDIRGLFVQGCTHEFARLPASFSGMRSGGT